MAALHSSPAEPERTRGFCSRCLRAPVNCYCAEIERIDPGFPVAILTHVREAQKHVATGRLAHLCLSGSHFFTGFDFASDDRVNHLLASPRLQPLVLFPGPSSVNLSRLSLAERRSLVPPGKTPLLVLIDGTWATARKAMARSPNLRGLPRISFDPPGPSRIRLREQPRPECLTTIEAIHHSIELLGPVFGWKGESRSHDALLRALDRMVKRQILLARQHDPDFWAD